MKFEVEKKFWLLDSSALETRLAELGVVLPPPTDQVDRYFAHPSRDFLQTDEALRLRSVGDENYLTYKGARIDSTTKTRRELKLELASGEAGLEFQQLLELLGFKPLMTVHKQRRQVGFTWQDYPVEICVDEIDQLGRFIELETTSDLEHLEYAKSSLESLSGHLQLDRQERRSYLELMLHHLAPQRFPS